MVNSKKTPAKTPVKTPPKPPMKATEVGVKLSDQKTAPKSVPVMTRPQQSGKALQGVITNLDARITLLQTQINNLTRQRDALKTRLAQTEDAQK